MFGQEGLEKVKRDADHKVKERKKVLDFLDMDVKLSPLSHLYRIIDLTFVCHIFVYLKAVLRYLIELLYSIELKKKGQVTYILII